MLKVNWNQKYEVTLKFTFKTVANFVWQHYINRSATAASNPILRKVLLPQ